MKLKRIQASTNYRFIVGKIYDGEKSDLADYYYTVKDEDGKETYGSSRYWEEVKEPITLTLGDLV